MVKTSVFTSLGTAPQGETPKDNLKVAQGVLNDKHEE